MLGELPVTVADAEPTDAPGLAAHEGLGRSLLRRAGRGRGRLRALHRGRCRAGASTTSRGSLAHVGGLRAAGLLNDDRGGRHRRRACAASRPRCGPGPSPGIRRSRTSTSTSRWRWPTRIGPVAGKLHTGRSRNDQVATDLRLWLQRRLGDIDGGPRGPGAGAGEPGPGCTETRSCPATRTCSRPSRCSSPTTCWPTWRCSSATVAGSPTRWPAPTVSPLGSGALAGAGFALDREAVAAELGFDGVTRNSIDAVGRPRLRRRDAGRGGAGHDAPLAPGRGARLVVQPGLRLPAPGRCLVDGLVDDAQQAQPRPGRARPRPDGPRGRPPGGRADAAQGPARRLPARPPGGQAAAHRRPGRAGVVARVS